MVEVIAEAGITHQGNLDTARKLADDAKWAGADVFKIQTFIPHKLFKKPPKGMDDLVLSPKDTLTLVKHCEDIKIEFMSTPGELDSLKFLVEECGVKRIKIGSDDLTYRPLIEAAYQTGKQVILSTGMADEGEVLETLSVLRPSQVRSTTLMHCVSLYPTPVKHAHLNCIRTLQRLTACRVGYSDHTNVPAICFMAVAMGAMVIEKHICPSGYKGPDDNVSMIPIEFRIFMASLRDYEQALGGNLNNRPDRVNIKAFRKGPDGLRE